MCASETIIDIARVAGLINAAAAAAAMKKYPVRKKNHDGGPENKPAPGEKSQEQKVIAAIHAASAEYPTGMMYVGLRYLVIQPAAHVREEELFQMHCDRAGLPAAYHLLSDARDGQHLLD